MFTRVKPLGWAFLEILTSTQMNQLDTNVSRAVDGLNGGTYTLAVMLELAGAGVKFSSVAEFAAAATSFTGTGTVTVGVDTAWTFNNPVLFNALATFAGGFSLPIGASATIANGADVTNHGTLTNDTDGAINNLGVISNEGVIANAGGGRFRRKSVNLPSADTTVTVTDGNVFWLPNSGAAFDYTLDDTGAVDDDEVEFRQKQIHAAPAGHRVILNGLNILTFGTQAVSGEIKAVHAFRRSGVWDFWYEHYIL